MGRNRRKKIKVSDKLCQCGCGQYTLTHRDTGKPNKYIHGQCYEPYHPDFNNKLKEQIRKRDNYTCQLCGKKQDNNERSLSVHHIDYNKKNCSKDNLISLCAKCHSTTNANRQIWACYFQEVIYCG